MKHRKDALAAAEMDDRPAPDFEGLAEAAGDIIYTLDLAGHFTYCNRACVAVLGYPPGSLIGRSFTGILTPASARIAMQHFMNGVAGQERTPFFDVDALHCGGSVVKLEVRSGSLMRDGELVGRQGIARNITEIRSLQALVAEQSERVTLLEERSRAAMDLYARITELVFANSAAQPSAEGLRELEGAAVRLIAAKHGMNLADITLLNLLAKGLSNKDIARLISRSPHTVKDNVQKVMQRLGVKRRAEAVACAAKLGLISLN
jgi:PAS domain S-box-containing protein